MRCFKEKVSDFLVRLTMPLFRLKWWIESRDERKKFREVEEWRFLLHGYKSCIFYGNGKCARPRRLDKVYLKLKHSRDYPECKKRKCKYYFYDLFKDG